MFSSRSLIVSAITFRAPVICFVTFVNYEKSMEIHFSLVVVWLFQCHLLRIVQSFHWIVLKINSLYMSGSVSENSLLFYWAIGIALYYYVSCCYDYCCFIISLEKRQYKFSNFFFPKSFWVFLVIWLFIWILEFVVCFYKHAFSRFWLKSHWTYGLI